MATKVVTVTINLEIEVPEDEYESLLDDSEAAASDLSGRDQMIWQYIADWRDMDECYAKVTSHGIEVSEAL